MSKEWFAIEKSTAKAAIVQEVQPLLDRIRQLSDELDLARDCLKRGDERDIQWAQYKKALQDIADGTCLVFDEGEEREVEVWMDAEDLQEIARKALGDPA